MRKTPGILAISLAICGAIQAAEPRAGKNADKEPGEVRVPTEKKSAAQIRAEAINIPKLAFRESTVCSALEFLALKSRQLDREGKGVNIILAPPLAAPKRTVERAGGQIPAPIPADAAQESVPAATPRARYEGPPITLLLENVTVAEAVKRITQIAGVGIRWDEHAAFIRMPAGESILKAQKVPPPKPRPPVKNSIGKFGDALLARYAKQPILPEVDFREADISTVFGFLTKKHRELDEEGGSVNSVLKIDVAYPPVTLRATNIPVFEALRYAAESAGFDVSLNANDENGAVFILVAPAEPPKKQ